MFEAIFGTIVEYYQGLSLPFVLAFLAVLVLFVHYNVRWVDERKRLRTDERDFRAIMRSIEDPDGALAELLGRRVTAPLKVCEELIDLETFRQWLGRTRLVDASNAHAEILIDFLYGVLSSPRALTVNDNRLSLTASRNRLKRHRYHRVINVALASIAVSLGILGTVAGLWLAFKQADFTDVAKLGSSLGQVMTALSRALYTTGTGIIISIPMVAIGLRMEDQLEHIFGQLEEIQEAIIATLIVAKGKG